MKIGEKTLKRGGELLTNSLLTFQKSINEAFLKAGEDELKITMGLSIKAGPGNGNFKLQSKIKFVTDQIEETFSDSVDELQTDLFKDQPTKKCPLENGDERLETYCAKCPSRRKAILVSGKKMPFILPMSAELPILAPGEMIQHRSCSAWADDDYNRFIGNQLLSCVVKEKPVSEEKPKLKKNSCGTEVFNGICSHLWCSKGDGEYESNCVEPKTLKEILCCRECPEKRCNSRCANADIKKEKKKKAA